MGRPHIDKIVYRIIPDTATMFMETRAGRLDVMDLSPLQYLRQTSGPVWEREFRKYRYLASMYVFLGFNLEHPFFKDVRVRRAISLALDRDALIKGVLLGQGIPAFGPFKPGTWASHPTLKPLRQDLAAARALLAQAGFADHDHDGILDRDGKPLAFTILTNQGNEQRILTATVIQSQLRAIGVDVRIRTVEWAAFIREFVNKGRFDAVLLGWTIPQDPDIYQVWHSSQAVEGASTLPTTAIRRWTHCWKRRAPAGPGPARPALLAHSGNSGPGSALLLSFCSLRPARGAAPLSRHRTGPGGHHV